MRSPMEWCTELLITPVSHRRPGVPRMSSTFFDRVTAQATDSAHNVALSRWVPGKGFTTITYGDLLALAREVIRVVDTSLPQCQVFPILAGKSFESVATMVAALGSGRSFCFLNPKWRPPQIQFALHQLQASVCFLDSAGLLAFRSITEQDSWVRGVQWIVLEGDEPRVAKEARTRLAQLASVRSFTDAAGRCFNARESTFAPVFGDFVGACLFTSGSTGRPKGVLVPAGDLDGRIGAEIEWFELTRDDVLLNVLPFSFDVGLAQIMTGLALGAEVVMLESWLPKDILFAIAERSCTCIAAVPSIWIDFLKHGVEIDASGRHRSLRYVTVSGGSLPTVALGRLADALRGVRIFKTYGQTEAFRSTSLRPEDLWRKPNSVGTPFPGVHVRVVRDDGSPCLPGEVGEVVHCGLGTMLRYLDEASEPEDQRKLRRNQFFGAGDEHPFAVFTGDLGFLDEDGYLFLKGRRDDLVKILGNRVYPSEVVEQIASLEGVDDAVVLPIQGASGEAELVAFVVTNGAQCEPTQLRKLLGKRLPSYMVPKHIVLVHTIPRGATGKVDARQLLRDHGFGPLLGDGPEATSDRDRLSQVSLSYGK